MTSLLSVFFSKVTANRLPSMQSVRQSYYQHHPPSVMANSAMSRGRSLTPPSYKQNARLPSMNHLRTQDFYPPYYPPHPAAYHDPAYYRTYGDPYLMQRLPPPGFLPPTSSPPPSSSRAYRHMFSSSSDLDRHSSGMSRRRSRRSRSRSRRRYEVRPLLSLSFLSSIIIEIDLYHRTTNITSFLIFIIIIVSSLSLMPKSHFDDRLNFLSLSNNG